MNWSMDLSHQEKLLIWKANKARVIRVYTLYKRALEQDPNITMHLWFCESFDHLKRLYNNYKDASWIVLNYSDQIFINDAEYRMNDWYIRLMESN